jgi:amino acid adenylation domain-containing protein
MSHARGLHQFLVASAERFPNKIAIEDPGDDREISYAELHGVARSVNDRLRQLGVMPGDRVGLCIRKSIDALASIYGTMYAGAAYVPVDPDAPARRNAFIHHDCGVSAVIVGRKLSDAYQKAFEALGTLPPMIVVDDSVEELPLSQALESLQEQDPAAPAPIYDAEPDDVAYILYTSGSTGKPKGVVLTHENGVSYVDWCSDIFAPTENDRCSSHAPLHFDLSILDLYLAAKHGATLVLIGAGIGKEPVALAPLIAERKISIWYSAPSILGMLAQFGNLEDYDYSSLRMVFFAGEVFPIKHLRNLVELWPHPVYYNLYGPTETNVCTYYRVPDEIDPERTQPYPIGKCCEHLECMVIDEDGLKLDLGNEGELVVRGPAVTQGYWNLPERNALAFHTDADGEKWYKTGDLVIEDEDGVYDFLGRRDRMIKKRGYRIELGEIESALYEHDDVKDAAVIAGKDAEDNVIVHAYYCTNSGDALSVIQLKIFCSDRIPRYMVPDFFHNLEAMPRTSTGKADYQKLAGLN